MNFITRQDRTALPLLVLQVSSRSAVLRLSSGASTSCAMHFPSSSVLPTLLSGLSCGWTLCGFVVCRRQPPKPSTQLMIHTWMPRQGRWGRSRLSLNSLHRIMPSASRGQFGLISFFYDGEPMIARSPAVATCKNEKASLALLASAGSHLSG